MNPLSSSCALRPLASMPRSVRTSLLRACRGSRQFVIEEERPVVFCVTDDGLRQFRQGAAVRQHGLGVRGVVRVLRHGLLHQRVAQAVALVGVFEQIPMVDDAVHDRKEEPLIAEDAVPLDEREVGRHDDAALFVAVGDHLEEQPRPVHSSEGSPIRR